MKQKNIVLLVLVAAVGCSREAEFLPTRPDAVPQIETVKVPVAKEDILIGTILTKEVLEKSVDWKEFPKEGLPPEVVLNPEDLLGKRPTATIGKGEPFTTKRLTTKSINLPKGMHMKSIPMSAADNVFVGHGSRVDVVATRVSGSKLKSVPLLVDVLVLAVNDELELGRAGVPADVNTVTFALTQEQALLLELAQKRGCHLSLMLRGPDAPPNKDYDMEQVKKRLEND